MQDWKNVVGFEDYFKVSPDGDIWSKRSNKILKTHINTAGYKTVATKIGGRSGINYCFKVHRLVAEAYLEKPSDELVLACSLQGSGKVLVRHLDNNPLNCHYTNLAWGTHQDNSDDMVAAGRHLLAVELNSGENNTHAKLTKQQVDRIREEYIPRCKQFGVRALAKTYGVVHSTISRCLHNQSYK